MRTVLAISLASCLLAASPGRQVAQAQVAKPFTLAQVWRLDAAYADRQHPVRFRYPSVWKAATQFGYIPPLLAQSTDPEVIAGFSYAEGGFPRERIVGPYAKTNLEGFGLVYSALPVKNAVACEAKASSLAGKPVLPAVTFGGRAFSQRAVGGAEMSQSIEGRLYATYAENTCYLFETDVAVASPGALDNTPALTSGQRNFIDTHLLDIMRTVHIDS